MLKQVRNNNLNIKYRLDDDDAKAAAEAYARCMGIKQSYKDSADKYQENADKAGKNAAAFQTAIDTLKKNS